MRKFRRAAVLLLSVLLALALCACSHNTVPEDTDPADIRNGDTVGMGAAAMTVEVTDADGNKTTFEVHTDAKTVGAALQELNLISGEKSDYGLYIKQVLGITADYEADGTYWAFYIDGQYAATGADMTDINPGSVYSFVVEKMQ